MKRFSVKESMQRGSLMVEALALLGLITMVTPILYKKSAERTTELQDINVATQMRMLSSAVDDFVKDNYHKIGEDHSENQWELSADDILKLEEYLPHGFNLGQSKLFDDFKIAINKATVLDRNNVPHNIYTSAVLAPLKENLSMMRSSKIASMIGANGGVYRKSSAGKELSGVQGTWAADYQDYFAGEDTDLADGSIVIISSEAISSSRGDASSEDVLYRVSDGDTRKNTMQTTLLMGGNPIKEITNLIASSGGDITIGNVDAEKSNLIVTGLTTLNDKLEVITGGMKVVGNSGNSANTGIIEVGSSDASVKVGADGLTVTTDSTKIADAAKVEALVGTDGLTVTTDSTKIVDAAKVEALVGTDGLTVTTDSTIIADVKEAFIGISHATNGSHEGLLFKPEDIVLRNSGGSLTVKKNGDEGEVILSSLKSKLEIKDDSVVISTDPENNKSAKMTVSPEKVGFENKYVTTGDGAVSATGSLFLDKGVLKFASNDNSLGFIANEKGVAFGEDINSSGSIDSDNGISNKLINLKSDGTSDGRKVAISRKGIIEIAAPTSEADGFIRARRLVSDVEYPGKDNDIFVGKTAAGGDVQNRYDYYQVNPAYTSVMNDIKLATRGGARLSDILPDFINKGIYVVDNTYKDEKIGNAWPNITATGKPPVLDATYDCGADNSCIASPWMGFIPSPQCPKNYAKVVTLSPFRWRMSEVFSVWIPEDFSGNYKEALSTKFWSFFTQERNPRNAEFVLSDGYSEEHSHFVVRGNPTTFQTNTFLNTSMEPKYRSPGSGEEAESADTLVGWHALMGFLYNRYDYEDVLTELLGRAPKADGSEEFFWNVFPVYAQDMAAIANVYCAFDHSDTGPSWNNAVVDKYDQINNYRDKYQKSSSWSEAVNDPTLGYDDAW